MVEKSLISDDKMGSYFFRFRLSVCHCLSFSLSLSLPLSLIYPEIILFRLFSILYLQFLGNRLSNRIFLLNIFQSSFNISQTIFFSYNHFICSIILLFYLLFNYCVNIFHFKFLLIFILLFNCSIIKIYYIVIDYFHLI